ncbi:RHS repeat protein [Carboxylicivirga sediminis]|uniref:RHS repeat protein n=1 Tax=Carboxylicivirga sediminis TaxID=2006564 RepID=A0A941IXQ3_9BACT|nr:RHS repeat domain-containing protein [Carboxylicivirga sediminis]MBR8534942.1 RHS repeat protein [Carboxylicivirga sediminis]
MIRIIKIVFWLVIYLMPLNTFGQNEDYSRWNSNMSFPSSPTAASLGKYGEYPVNLQNGLVNISIPLYTINTKRLSVPISLSYHASGVKVDQEASWIGLGWDLMVGGVITRSIKGAADDFVPNGYRSRCSNIRAEGSFDFTDENDYLFAKRSFEGEYDSEPDIYNYNFNGYTGQFLMGNDGEFYTMGLDNLKILTRSIWEFEIITPDGTIYQFGRSLDGEDAYEETEIIPSRENYIGINKNITAWYLTDIVSSDKSDTIKFKYGNTHGYGSYNLGSQTYSIITEAHGNNAGNLCVQSYNWGGTSISIQNCRKLSEIHFSNGKLSFDIASDRQDGQSVRLANVRVYELIENDLYKEIKNIEFLNDAYFDRPWSGKRVETYKAYENNDKSLKLNAIVVHSPNCQAQNYGFEYNTTKLPARKTTAQDFWGYYNGEHSNNSLVPETKIASCNGTTLLGNANRAASALHVQACVLNQITYPTGGTTQFEFEPHYYLNNNLYQGGSQTELVWIPENVMAVGHVSEPSLQLQTKLVDTVTIIPKFSGDAHLSYEFSRTIGHGLNYPKLILTDDIGRVIYEVVHHQTDQIVSDVVNIHLNARTTYTLRVETCDCTNDPDAIINASYASATISYMDVVEVTDPKEWDPSIAGGLRIKAVKSYDVGKLEPSFIKGYVYGDISVKGGVGVGMLVSPTIRNYSKSVKSAGVGTVIGDPDSYNKTELFVSSTSYVDFGYNGGSPVEYNKVTEYIGTVSQNIGKNEYFYTGTDHIIGFLGNEYFPFDYLLYPEYLKSQTDKIISYGYNNGNYYKVKEEDYSYTNTNIISVNALKFLQKEVVTGAYVDASANWDRKYIPVNYAFKLGNSKLKSKSTIVYNKNGGEPVASSITYTYDPQYNQITEELFKDSKGNMSNKKLLYPYQKSQIAGLTDEQLSTLEQMVITNQINQAIEEKNYSNGLLNVWLRRNYKTLSDGAVLFDYGEQSFKGLELEDVFIVEQYDDYRNVSQYKDEKLGYSTSVIYGYNYTLSVIKADKIDYVTLESVVNNVLQTYFGSQTLDIFMTGLSDMTLPANKYSWEQFNTHLRNASSLQDALITTYTYDPLKGMTSQTDPNGITTYYEYDGFGRLKCIKDHSGNIIKNHTYHYKNEPNQ